MNTESHTEWWSGVCKESQTTIERVQGQVMTLAQVMRQMELHGIVEYEEFFELHGQPTGSESDRWDAVSLFGWLGY
jgi:hypothetical protein